MSAALPRQLAANYLDVTLAEFDRLVAAGDLQRVRQRLYGIGFRESDLDGIAPQVRARLAELTERMGS